GTNPYQTISSTSIAKLMAKSTSAIPTVAIGTISRGKYTLLIRLALPTTLFEASESTPEKKAHGSIQPKTMIAYGPDPTEGRLAKCPKMTVNTTIVRNGRMTAQAAPITVCLYRTETSRQAKTRKSSRYRQRSRQ